MSEAFKAYILQLDKESVIDMIKCNNQLKISKREVEFLNKKQNFEIMKILVESKVLY